MAQIPSHNILLNINNTIIIELLLYIEIKHNKNMKNILTEIDFQAILAESQADTQTGNSLLNRYRAHLMANESTCALVNNFIREAAQLRYDNSINNLLEHIVDFISSNKIRWQIATACENINRSNSQYNYLNLNAAKQAEKLIDLNEDECVRYIKSGALKNVMYCEAFRTIAKSVYKDQPVIVENEHTITHPVSIVEKQGTDVYFEISGELYKINEDDEISEAQWNEVSNTFKNVTSLLESKIITNVEDTFFVKLDKSEYQISLNEDRLSIVKLTGEQEREFTIEQLREDNALTLVTTNPRFKNQVAQVLECVAQLAENMNNIIRLDNVMVVESVKNKFLVIEHEDKVFAKSLFGYSGKWQINEDALKAIDFIKSKTKIDLSENLKEAVKKTIANVSEEEKQKMAADLHNKSINETKARIEILTEKFKNDPAKLAVLSKLAQDLQGL